MKVTDRKAGPICIIKISGHLKLGPVVDRFAERFDELLQSGERRFVFDMLDVPWMDTSGINANVACLKHLRDKDEAGEIKVALKDKNHKLFVLYELQKLFELHGDVESALAAFAVKA